MSDGRKQIMSPFTGHKKRKTWNKTREYYKLVKKDKIQLKQVRDHITIKRNDEKNFQTVKPHFTIVTKVIIVILMMKIIMKRMISSS